MSSRVAALGLTVLALGCAPPLDEVAEPIERWGPRDSDLVFTSDRGGDSEIYLLPAGSRDWINLTRDPGSDNWPVWAPDGRRIAFQSRRAGNLDIWSMNADGTDASRLTSHPEHDYLPSWSPDGEWITFVSRRDQPGDGARANHAYRMRPDGSELEWLPMDSPGTSSGIEWSPDGERIAMTRLIDGVADLFLSADLGAGWTRLTDDAAYDGTATFSPDGERLVFYSALDSVSHIVLFDLATGARRPVVETGQNWYPRFSPDGRWLTFTTARDVEGEDLDVVALSLDGEGEAVLLAGGPGRESEGRWRSGPPRPADDEG